MLEFLLHHLLTQMNFCLHLFSPQIVDHIPVHQIRSAHQVHGNSVGLLTSCRLPRRPCTPYGTTNDGFKFTKEQRSLPKVMVRNIFHHNDCKIHVRMAKADGPKSHHPRYSTLYVYMWYLLLQCYHNICSNCMHSFYRFFLFPVDILLSMG